jgi:histidine triad (HIT) family protein
MSECIFCRIASKQIPASLVYEDDTCVAFHDIGPKAPVHVLVIPKAHVRDLADAEPGHETLLGHLLLTAAQIARDLGVDESGYRVVINRGPDAGQSVDHLHLHLTGGRPMGWPPWAE